MQRLMVYLLTIGLVLGLSGGVVAQSPEFDCANGTSDTLNASQSGTTSTPLTESPGADSLTFCAEAFLARISVAQEQELGQLMVVDQSCGPKCSESLGRWHAPTCSWKTHQCCLVEGLMSFSEPLPRV